MVTNQQTQKSKKKNKTKQKTNKQKQNKKQNKTNISWREHMRKSCFFESFKEVYQQFVLMCVKSNCDV